MRCNVRLVLMQWMVDRCLPVSMITEQQPPEIKPEKVGVYYVTYVGDGGAEGHVYSGWCHWDGTQWGVTCSEPAMAAKITSRGLFQSKTWWGLTQEMVG